MLSVDNFTYWLILQASIRLKVMTRLSTQRRKRLLQLIAEKDKKGYSIREIARMVGVDRQLVQYYIKSYTQGRLAQEGKVN